MRSLLTSTLLVLMAVALAACGGHKITASRAAALLKAEEPTWQRVACRPYSGGSYWDYTCRVKSRVASPFSFEVKVDGSRIVDQSAP